MYKKTLAAIFATDLPIDNGNFNKMKYLKPFIIILKVFACTSCGTDTGYKVKSESVSYTYWNAGMGIGSKTFEIPEADPKTFKILNFNNYAKDDKKVFYKGEIIDGADASSFEAIGEFYARDNHRGYYAKDSIKHSNGKTFKIIDSYYSTDSTDIFYITKSLGVTDPKNFKFVFPAEEESWDRWTTDGLFYYYREFKVPSKDYSNMTIYRNSGGISKDNKWVYFLDHKLNYNQDGKQIIDTIDVESFTVTGFIECRDKYGCFNVYHGRTKCK